VPDHHRALVGEVELEVLEIGVAVVPGDERGRGPRARQTLTRYPEPTVGLRAERIHHRAVEIGELGMRHVPADLDVAEEPKPRVDGDPLERARDRLAVRIVRRDAYAHETPTGRQPLDQVELDAPIPTREQGAGGTEA